MPGDAQAQQFHPQHPEVLEYLREGVKFLEENEDPNLGGKCVAALAVMKAIENDDEDTRNPREHPVVQRALSEARRVVLESTATKSDNTTYNNCLTIIFLCEYDPQANADLVKKLLDVLLDKQKSNGAWGYPNLSTGDTSQTQYAVLALWEASRAGYDIDAKVVRQALAWLYRTQDPSGTWGYQGMDPGPGQNRIEQAEKTVSMLAAGLSSTLICANLLGEDKLVQRTRSASPGEGQSEDGGPVSLEDELDLPPGVRLVDAKKKKSRRPGGGIGFDRDRLRTRVQQAEDWFAKNFTIDFPRYGAYYLYSLERYKSFKEYLTGGFEDSPPWYNEGFRHFKKKRQANNSWDMGCSESVDTAFAMLFMVRSMRRSLRKPSLGGGALLGGRGAIADPSKVKFVKGRLVIEETQRSLDELIAVLQDPTSAEYQRLQASAAQMKIAEVKPADVQPLRQLARGGEPAARLLAVRALGHRSDLDDVPTFLYALTDPDRRVALAARDALRFTSRKLDGLGMPDDFTDRQRFDAYAAWKAWYLRLRPEAQLD